MLVTHQFVIGMIYITLKSPTDDSSNGCYRIPDEHLPRVVAEIARHWKYLSTEFRHNPYKSPAIWDFIRNLTNEIIKDHGGTYISQARINRDADIMMSNRPEFGLQPYIGCKKVSIFQLVEHYIVFISVGQSSTIGEVNRRVTSPISEQQKSALARHFVQWEAPLIWEPSLKRESFESKWKQHLKVAPDLYPQYQVHWGSSQSTKYDWLHNDV